MLFAIVFGVESLLPDATPISGDQLTPVWKPREVEESGGALDHAAVYTRVYSDDGTAISKLVSEQP